MDGVVRAYSNMRSGFLGVLIFPIGLMFIEVAVLSWCVLKRERVCACVRVRWCGGVREREGWSKHSSAGDAAQEMLPKRRSTRRRVSTAEMSWR